MRAVMEPGSPRALWAFLRRTRHRIAAVSREEPLRHAVLAPVIEALATAEAALLSEDPDLPMRRGRGPRAATSVTPPGLDSLRARIDELERAVRVREEHIAIVAHDLRGPLSPVLLLLGRLIDDVKGKAGAIAPEMLAPRLDAIAARLEQFVDKLHVLLDLTRLQTEDLGLAPEAVDLREIADEVARQLATDPKRAPIHVGGEDELVGRWDRLRVEQILRNLMSNAVRYGAMQPVEVTVKAGPTADLAVLSVRDRGAGIRPEHLERIFEKFTKLGRSSDGFGIGLWIVRQLATAMGGMVTVESELGRGSTFTVTLPRRAGR